MYSLKCGMKPRHCDHLHICMMRLCHAAMLVIDGVSLPDCTNLEWLCHVGCIGTWYMLECSLLHSHNTQSWVCIHAMWRPMLTALGYMVHVHICWGRLACQFRYVTSSGKPDITGCLVSLRAEDAYISAEEPWHYDIRCVITVPAVEHDSCCVINDWISQLMSYCSMTHMCVNNTDTATVRQNQTPAVSFERLEINKLSK